ncbi:MFS transporter [Leucobacter sp. M11]|uniref:MFS transporter n=1 Tax=Leucobacter sp. M11 TaxID=2993565 RepID=UPI002D7EC892|nr:MFS transporter [Leucobacter sp. M11]
MALSDGRQPMPRYLAPIYLPTVFSTIAVSAITPLVPFMVTGLGGSLAVAGFFAGLLLIGQLLASVPSGRLVGRIGELPALTVAGVLLLIGSLALLVPALPVVALGLLAVGASASLFGLARHSYLSATAPLDRRGSALARLGGAARFGTALGPLVGSLFLVLCGTAGAAASGALAALLALGGQFLARGSVHAPVRTAAERALPRTRDLIRDARRTLSTVGVASAAVNLVRASRTVLLPLWALHLGLDEQRVYLVVLAGTLVDLALFPLGGRLLDRFGPRPLAVITTLGIGAGLACLPLASGFWPLAICAAAMGAGNGLGSGLLFTVSAQVSPRRNPGPALGVFRLVSDSGSAVTPVLISSITAVSGLAAASVTIGGIGVLAAALAARFFAPDWLRACSPDAPHAGERAPGPENGANGGGDETRSPRVSGPG